MPATDSFNARAWDRFALEPMYTAVSVQRVQDMTMHTLQGHAYDISEAGARIELDEALEVGERLAMGLHLPGLERGIYLSARVVWVHDEADDPAARRLAVQFTRFLTPDDRTRLQKHLGTGVVRRAG